MSNTLHDHHAELANLIITMIYFKNRTKARFKPGGIVHGRAYRVLALEKFFRFLFCA